MSNPINEQEVEQQLDQDIETPQTLAEQAQGLVEYGLIIALVAVLVIAALVLVGGQIQSTFNSIAASMGS